MRKDEFPIVDKLVKDSINDVLDKITVELKSIKEKWWYGVDNDCFMKLSDVIAVIDKYKAESEVRDDFSNHSSIRSNPKTY